MTCEPPKSLEYDLFLSISEKKKNYTANNAKIRVHSYLLFGTTLDYTQQMLGLICLAAFRSHNEYIHSSTAASNICQAHLLLPCCKASLTL